MSLSVATVLPLWVFIALMVATPGPANMLLMTAGAQQGYIRTLPFIAGLIVGKLGLNLLMALGLSGFLMDNPMLKQVFAVIAGSLYGVPGAENLDAKLGWPFGAAVCL